MEFLASTIWDSTILDGSMNNFLYTTAIIDKNIKPNSHIIKANRPGSAHWASYPRLLSSSWFSSCPYPRFCCSYSWVLASNQRHEYLVLLYLGCLLFSHCYSYSCFDLLCFVLSSPFSIRISMGFEEFADCSLMAISILMISIIIFLGLAVWHP